MTIEIVLVVVGVVFLIGSCMVQERLSEKDVDQIAKLGDEEIKIILEKKISSARNQIDEQINIAISEISELAQRQMELESNEKIMAINEYSDTVLESMNKTHNEIMFLYSMLNDKQKDITDLVSSIQDLSKKVKREPETMKKNLPQTGGTVSGSSNSVGTGMPVKRENLAPKRGAKLPEAGKPVIATDIDVVQNKLMNQTKTKIDESGKQKIHHEAVASAPLTGNHNVRILQLHKSGMSDVAIAKELNCGLGEVRLVLGLYKGENNNEN